MKKIIDKLRNDADYYGDEGKKFLSNSDIGTLLTNPKMFKARGETTKAMIEGSYFHTAMLEPEKLVNFRLVDASTRSTKIYKEALDESGTDILLLTHEASELDRLVSTMRSNLFFYDNIYRDGNIYEEPMVMEVFGRMWKGKADIVTDDMVIDIKTTSNIQDFRWSAKKYNYDSQCYLYQQFFDRPLVFYVIDKTNHNMGVFEPTEDFILGGREKVMRAIEVYDRFFGDDATEDVNNYFITEKL
jgi:hypothetical protein